ncbi:Ger(x)C family spore germination protein [Paenibacillus sinopodophylli]|uniref:Ger(x)C family spore germination protein n=1 Tax=Paenibacillus sinopodophylli TaxID=1837342 RepID=UPI00110CE887|nr:Ger(x)C family spore germination protein [Paenibacillus sinopodophylli]
MRPIYIFILLCLVMPVLSGCWDKLELNDWAFVQAAGIDLADDGRIRLTTQIYKPGGTNAQDMIPGKESSFFNMTSEGTTVFGASLLINNELGRKIQWSHMEALLIGENFSRKRNIGEVLDFFSRSNEPKSSMSIIVTHGDALTYLKDKPFVDNNIGQQLSSSIKTTEKQSGLSTTVTLTDLSIFAKQPSATFVIPFVYSAAESTLPPSNTTAIFSFPEGKLLKIVPHSKTPYLLMLMNKYQSGMITTPCSDSKNSPKQNDAFRIDKLETKISHHIKDNSLLLHVNVTVSGSVMELTCSPLGTEQEINHFTDQIENKLKKQLADTMNYIMAEKADVIGAGTYLHRYHNKRWKSWETTWNDRFSKSAFTIEAHVQLTHTGIDTGRPFTNAGK